MKHCLLTVGFVLACGAVAPVAIAGETVNVDLTQNGEVDSTSYPVTPDAHDLIFGVSEWEPPQPDDLDSPLHGLHGTCFGVTEYEDDTIVSGGGYCTHTDADGDRLVTRWVPLEQVMGNTLYTRGEWKVFEGSGKWEGATGSGEFRTTRTGDAGERRRHLTGTITLP